jgi:hypothetical protein
MTLTGKKLNYSEEKSHVLVPLCPPQTSGWEAIGQPPESCSGLLSVKWPWIVHKNWIPTAQKYLTISITTTNQLKILRNMITVTLGKNTNA